MSDEVTPKECFRYGADTREMLKKLEERWEESNKTLFTAIEGIKDNLMGRLPVWATVVMSILTMLVGALLSKVVFK